MTGGKRNFFHHRWTRRGVELITDARQSPLENYEHRKRVYMWLQGLRIPFLVLAALTYLVWHTLLIAWIFIIISIPLPWIAVVIANGIGEPRDPRAPQVYKPAVVREALQAQQQQALESGRIVVDEEEHQERR